MKKHLPLLLATIGVLFMAASFIYDFADIPWHDPPPDGVEHTHDENEVAVIVILRTIGLFALIIGGFLMLTRAVMRNGKQEAGDRRQEEKDS